MTQIHISHNQKKQEIQLQISEEIILLGSEAFFDFLDMDVLNEIGTHTGISTQGTKEEMVERFISNIFDLAPLEEVMENRVVAKEEPHSSEEENGDEPDGPSNEETSVPKKTTRKKDSKPLISEGITRSDLHKHYTVPELKSFVKDNFEPQDAQAIQKMKKEQIIVFILDKLSSKKRAGGKIDGEPPSKQARK
jgi:hypothetical protein